MAKNIITRAQVLTAVVEGDFALLAQPAAIEVASKMLASITRKSDAPKQPSKAAAENERLAQAVLAYMPAGEVVYSADIMAHVAGIRTPQKCAKVMSLLVDAGHVQKAVGGRYVGYALK